jgi:MFS family permease
MIRRASTARTNVRRIAIGRLISKTGGAAAYTALMFTVWDRTHSPAAQALALAMTFGVSGVLGPFAGALGDRFDRRLVMVWSEAVAAAAFLGMAFVDDPAWLIGIAFVAAVAEQPFFSASRAAIPNLIESEDDLPWANSLVTIGVHAGIAVGPVLGGVLLAATGASWVFALNALSFVVSLALTLSVRADFQERRPSTPAPQGGLSAGLVQLWRDWVMRRMSVAWFVFLLGIGMGMVADAPLAESFGAGEVGFALLIACWGLGSVAGSAAGRWMRPGHEPLWMVGGAFGVALGAFVVGFAPVFPLVLVGLLAFGICDGGTIVAEQAIMQKRTPDAVRSRTMAAFEAVLSIGLVVAFLLAGPVMRFVSAQSVYRIGGASALLAALWLVPILRLRTELGTDARFTSAEELDGAPVAADRVAT